MGLVSASTLARSFHCDIVIKIQSPGMRQQRAIADHSTNRHRTDIVRLGGHPYVRGEAAAADREKQD
jgi:hypothetical protein